MVGLMERHTTGAAGIEQSTRYWGKAAQSVRGIPATKPSVARVPIWVCWEKVRKNFARVFSRYATAFFETHFQLVPQADNLRGNFALISKSNFSIAMIFEFHENKDFRADWQRLVEANLCPSIPNGFEPSFEQIHTVSIRVQNS